MVRIPLWDGLGFLKGTFQGTSRHLNLIGVVLNLIGVVSILFYELGVFVFVSVLKLRDEKFGVCLRPLLLETPAYAIIYKLQQLGLGIACV